MKIIRCISTMIITFGLLCVNLSPAHAIPPIPSSFYGTILVNTASVPDNFPISAWIDGIQYAITSTLIYESDSVYSISIPGDDPSTTGIIEGGTEGQTVVFKIGPLSASQTGTWHSASNVSLNLTATGYWIFLPLIGR